MKGTGLTCTIDRTVACQSYGRRCQECAVPAKYGWKWNDQTNEWVYIGEGGNANPSKDMP